MIDTQTQNDLFILIEKQLKTTTVAYAFGGTAMMYYGYKNTTKDIDLVFEDEKQRDLFVDAITSLGYRQNSPFGIYHQIKLKSNNKPIMYTRGDERFDLFSKKIFKTTLTESMKKRFYARHDFGENLIIYVLSKEDLILLKSVTDREKDFDDIITIIQKEQNIDWNYIIDEAITQKKLGDSWIILDLEKTMQKLRKYTLLRKEYFDKLYKEME